ncbi:Type II/IV secretion system protein [uncultured archaeon]|nr:Type II/IV secretion system protein [uncultured archaeon]
MAYLDSLGKTARGHPAADPPPSREIDGPRPGPMGAPTLSPIKVSESEPILLESYGDVRVYKVPGDALYYYEVPSPHYKGDEKVLINSLIEIATKVITFDKPFSTTAEKRNAYFRQVMEIILNTPELRVPPNAKDFYANAVVQEMVGFGLIDTLLFDDRLEEVMVIGPGRPVFVFHRKYEMMRTNIVFYDDKDIRNLVDRIGRDVGRRIDFASPLLDARLADGTRVNTTIAPASIDGTTLTVRKFRHDPFTIVDLLNFNTLSPEIAAFLWLATDGAGAKPANILIAGGTASGKTSTLNMMASFVPGHERVISVEDTAELKIPLQHWIRMETRPPGVEQTGELDMNTLLKNVLRMRPDRIIVGEIRGEEGYTLFSAMNTGHSGAFGTVHSNSARETLIRLVNPPINVPAVMVSSLNLIVMQQRINDRRRGLIRRITEVAEVIPREQGIPDVQVLYQWDAATDTFVNNNAASVYLQSLSHFTGLSIESLKEELKTRQAVLEDLTARGVRGLENVCNITQSYILKQQGKI